MKVKICGITNTEDALLCESAGANALGFIFYKKSKRFILPKTAKEIIDHLSPFTVKVGVFVNETAKNINSIAEFTGLNLVQLHGDEEPNIITKIKFPVIKAFRVNEEFNYNIIEKFKNSYILLDSLSKNAYGGTGNSFNWNSIPLKIRNKIILSGGVSNKNIQYIIDNIKPAAVDLSSSIEDFPGKKSKQKVMEFFKIFNSYGV